MMKSISWSFAMLAVKKGQIVRVDKEKYLNSINVSSFVIPNLFRFIQKHMNL